MLPPLIVFGEDWGAHPSSTQHLIKRLTAERPVIWVNSIGLRRPGFNRRDLRRVWQKLRALLQHQFATKPATNQAESAPATSTTTAPNSPPQPTVIAPLAIPLPGVGWARAINRRLLRRQIQRTLQQLQLTDCQPVLWLSLPTGVDLIGQLNERAVIYYCGDDFSALSGVDHTAVSLLERELAEKADLILAASPALVQRFPADKTQLLPHGVDIRLFSTPQPRAADLPSGKPIAGFYGSISEWIDTELLAQTAERLPHWNFVLIGPIQTDIAPLHGKPNIFLLGPRPHHALPSYVQHWQVSMLPFRDNAQIRACNPLKLREYLAAQKPVASTDFPALDGYRELVHVGTDADRFTLAIQQAALDAPDTQAFHDWLAQSSPDWEAVQGLTQPRHARGESVSQQSWEARADDLNRLLDRL